MTQIRDSDTRLGNAARTLDSDTRLGYMTRIRGRVQVVEIKGPLKILASSITASDSESQVSPGFSGWPPRFYLVPRPPRRAEAAGEWAPQ